MLMPRLPLALALVFIPALAVRADDKQFAHVSLREVRNHATSYKATKVAFKCRLNKVENQYAPFYTPFVPDRFAQVSVWGPESLIFREKDRCDIFPNLFIRRDATWLPELLETHRYSWIYVWGEVVNDFNDQPWIEVTQFEVMSEKHYEDGTLGAMIRAYDAFSKGDLEAADGELARIPDYRLPKTDRYHAVKMKAQAAWALGKDVEAKREALRGLRIRPEDGVLQSIYEGTAPRALDEKKEEPKKEGEGENKSGSVDSLRDRLAALEKENAKLKTELEAAKESLANEKDETTKLAGEAEDGR